MKELTDDFINNKDVMDKKVVLLESNLKESNEKIITLEKILFETVKKIEEQESKSNIFNKFSLGLNVALVIFLILTRIYV